MIMRRLRHLFRNSRGSAAVEFAFVAPIMMAFLIGMVEMGRLFLIHNAMTFAVDESARAAMVRKTISKPELEALTRSFASILEPERTNVTITVTPYDDGWRTNVSLHYEFHLMVSFLGLGAFDMERRAQVTRRDSF
jgi:Flp pilus assembly protein TadG